MNVRLIELVNSLAGFRPLLLFLSLIFLLSAFTILVIVVIEKLHCLVQNKQKARELSKDNLKNLDYSKVKKEKKGKILRKMAVPDAVDPGPNSYLKIDDGGTEIYVRSFTVVGTPRDTQFANTFANLFDFPGCTSSVFVEPEAENVTSRKMDQQIKVLGSEYMAASRDPNRSRKIRAEYQEANSWAEQVESGENKFYKVAFVFSFCAESLQQLNKISDSFRSRALMKSVYISNAYAVQAEAYLLNAPYNGLIQIGSKYIKTKPLKYFDMDKFALSTVFNYTQSSFSHKDGIILGHDMDTDSPLFYDLFDPSHDGYTAIIAGKTGSGKSALIKMFVCRSTVYDYHFVCIDSQKRKGVNEGEFAGPAECVNGVNYKISSNSDFILNPFEIGETTKTIKDGMDTVRELRTLELNDKISMVVHTLSTMLQGAKEFSTIESMIPVTRILTDTVASLYQEFGIRDGDADSLYTMGTVVKDGKVMSGKVKKLLPTMTDFYKKALISAKANTDESLKVPYNLILMGTKDFVKELYYSADSITFIDKTQYETLPYRDSQNKSLRVWSDGGVDEDVIIVKGIRSYYDGQSTVSISPECPFTNLDLSLLPENDKVLARQIAMDVVNEMFIKRNSEDIKAARKLVCIFDECHENFAFPYSRKALDNISRTARKRNVGLFLASQTLAEYQLYPETQAILKQATTKFVFKQDNQDKAYLMESLSITESQAERIVNSLGGIGKSEESARRHRGEVCIVDNKNVAFCKVDYLKSTEGLAVDTDAREIEKIMKYSASA